MLGRKQRREDPRRNLYARLGAAWFFLLVVVALGTLVYRQLGDGRWSLYDCFYMTVITVSTVGYGEVLDGFSSVPGARGFTTMLVVLGSGTLVYAASTMTAFVVEGDLLGALKENRMQKRIDQLTGHIIVCGAGSTGMHILNELAGFGESFVVIDHDGERLARMSNEQRGSLLHVEGDATEDGTLVNAGVERARGLITALHDDKDNLFVTISARAMNPRIRIVAKATEHSAEPKLRRAGANTVVSPYQIGGIRMVSEILRPQVVRFLDEMLSVDGQTLSLEEAAIPEASALAGVALRDTSIREKTDALVVAVRDEGGRFVYNPAPSFVLQGGMTLIILAKNRDAAAASGRDPGRNHRAPRLAIAPGQRGHHRALDQGWDVG